MPLWPLYCKCPRRLSTVYCQSALRRVCFRHFLRPDYKAFFSPYTAHFGQTVKCQLFPTVYCSLPNRFLSICLLSVCPTARVLQAFFLRPDYQAHALRSTQVFAPGELALGSSFRAVGTMDSYLLVVSGVNPL